jgi:hypothetical protein
MEWLKFQDAAFPNKASSPAQRSVVFDGCQFFSCAQWEIRTIWRFAESTLEALRITSSDPETTALPRPGIAEVVECVYFYTGDKQNAVIVLFCIAIH